MQVMEEADILTEQFSEEVSLAVGVWGESFMSFQSKYVKRSRVNGLGES